MWILRRSNENIREILYDRFMIDGSGEWRAVPGKNGAINIPLQFKRKADAEREMKREIEKEPWWDYEIDEYLR